MLITSQITKIKSTIFIFSDAATSAKAEMAVGIFLCLNEEELHEISSDIIKKNVVYKKYKTKRSTWAEIKTAIHALNNVIKKSGTNVSIEMYTDCQSLCDLLGRRRAKLKKNNFMTRTGKTLQHANLYKELFAFADQLHIKIVKIKGHAATANRVTIYEKIFTILDKLSREKLRYFVNNNFTT